MATQAQLEAAEVSAYILFNKAADEPDNAVKRSLEKQYEEALKEINRLETELTQKS